MAAALADGVLNTRNLRRVTCGREPDPGDPRPALLASAGGAAIAEGRRKGLGRRSWDGGLTNLWPLSPGGTKEGGGGGGDDADGGDDTNKSRARRRRRLLLVGARSGSGCCSCGAAALSASVAAVQRNQLSSKEYSCEK